MDVPKIIKQLDKVFSELAKPVSQCISVHSDLQVHIFDPNDGKDSYILVLLKPDDEQQKKVFTIRNPNQKELAIWAYDGCTDLRLFEGDLVKSRCDAIAFNDREIVFAELKLEGFSTGDYAVENTRKKATTQLLASITVIFDHFAAKNMEMPWSHFEAYVATHPTFPRTGASDKKLAAKINELGVLFFELNIKVMH